MSVPWKRGTPQFPLQIVVTSAPSAVICSRDTRMSGAPTPQLAPNASGAAGRSAKTRARSPGSSPIIVRPAVSNEQVAVYGIPAAMDAVAAARTSSGADIVSIQMTSAPPAASPSICSRKTATASSRVSAPSGSNRSPVGPTEPATTTGRSAASATPRAMAAAALANSVTRCSARWRANRLRLHPNVLVRMMSAPASTKRWCRRATRAGWSTFQNSGGSPASSPISK